MKILYVCNDLDYFKAHRMFLAQAMVSKNWQVALSTGGVEASKTKIENDQIKILPLDLDRHKLNLKSDLGLIAKYLKQVKTEKPDVVHAITIKPILFMGIALLINKLMLRSTPKLVWTFPGLGKVFEPDSSIRAILRKTIVSGALWLSNIILKPHATFENYSSMEALAKNRIITKENSSVVMGAGLDREQFFSSQRKGDLVILFASRLLKAKGLGEYIEAARILKTEYPKAVFQVAGKQEEENPDAFPMSDIQNAHDEGHIKYIGAIAPDEMPKVLRQADIHVAPSKLQEGLPRVVLEAASCGCYPIASDHEMLRHFIVNGETGLLLKEVSVNSILKALRPALSKAKQTRQMGQEVAQKAKALPIYEDNLIAHFLKIYKV